MRTNPCRWKQLCVLFIVFIGLGECSLSTSTDRGYLAPYLGRQYKLKSSDNNFEKIMKALNVGTTKRSAAKMAKPILTLTENDEGEYTLSTYAKVKSFSTTFKIGNPYEETTPDGRKVISTFYQDKNKLTHIQEGKQVVTIVHVFKLDELEETIELGTLATHRTYKYISKPTEE